MGQEVVDQMQGARAAAGQLVFCAPQAAWASVDRLRIEQVVTNLLDNAIKFSPPDGCIDVVVDGSMDESVRVTVRDYGIGVAPEHRPHLFERFYQADTASHQSGLGLGLYVSREIATLHGGTLRAEFPADGGSCFVVTVPRSIEATLTSEPNSDEDSSTR